MREKLRYVYRPEGWTALHLDCIANATKAQRDEFCYHIRRAPVCLETNYVPMIHESDVSWSVQKTRCFFCGGGKND